MASDGEQSLTGTLGTHNGAGSVMGAPSPRPANSLSQMTPGASQQHGGYSTQPTPVGRADLGYYIGHRPNTVSGTGRGSVLAPSESFAAMEDAEGDADATFIWGTNLSVSRVQSRFTSFIKTFRLPEEFDPKYLQLLQETRERGEVSFNIDGHHMHDFDRTLYMWAITYPAETVPIFDGQLSAIAAELEGTDPEEIQVQARIYNLLEIKVIRDLNPSDINRMIAVSGMVTRTSGVIPDQSLALFRCMQCGHEVVEWNDRGKVNEPSTCPSPSCQARYSMQMLYNRSCFLDKQLMKMQENPNDIPEGETPHTVTMFSRQDLVDLAKPGDRITVTGVYRAAGVRVNPRLRETKAVYKTYLDVVHVEKNESTSLFSLSDTLAAEEGEELPAHLTAAAKAGDAQNNGVRTNNVTGEEMAEKRTQLQAIAADPDVYEKLAASLAPSIWQLDDVKKGLLCQLFGGVSKTLPGVKTRGEINVLLVGDPGVSKSQILSYVHKLAPRGIYTSGKGSSAVGLTAYVTRDPETKEMVLESGALVLSDRGICCIDEFDKMSEAARSMLHEVMEQQTISVAKAGIIATLNARTSVLASANPVGSRYNPQLSVVENIQLPPSLMSRFDLIYLLLDKPNEASDRKLAKHLVSLFGDRSNLEAKKAPIAAELLKEYIAFARATCHPALSSEAAEALATSYAEMRSMGMSRKTVSATPRQLESLIRLSESLARMRLAATVTVDDVTEAVRLMKVAMQQSSIDPRTGQIDMDVIQTGVSAAERGMKARLSGEVRALLQARLGGQGMRLAELLEGMNAQASVHVSERDLRLALSELEEDYRLAAGVITART
ncbi:MCM4 [Auxenochlorella protothecoides x Auxenochlorella symbiontica]